MNASSANQAQTFMNVVVVPAFDDLKAALAAPEKTVTLIKSSEPRTEAVKAVLLQMHPETPYLDLNQNLSSLNQTWIVASLSIEILKHLEAEPFYIGQYCLSIEIIINPLEQIEVTFIVGYSTGKKSLEIQRRVFEDNHQRLEIEDILRSDIIKHFLENFYAFKRQYLESALTLAESPEANSIAPDLYLNEPTPPNPDPSSPNPDEAQPEPTPFIDLQTLYDLSKQLAQTLAPPGFPITSKLNPKLPTPAHIKPIQDRYGRTIDLSLEYSPAITEPELTEQLHRLSHYQTLKHLAHLHIFLQEQMQAWFKQNGQPSLGAIAPHLQQQITQLRDHLYQRIQALTDSQLDSTAQTLKQEIETLTTQQQHQQTLLDQLDQNPLLGYLDTHLLDPTHQIKEPIQPFTDPNQPIDIPAQHYKAKNSKSILSHIAPCDSEKYKTYHQRKLDRPTLKLIIEYAITQKLYPQRPVFIGITTKAVYPRLELLWGQSDTPTNSLNQIWCIYPMMRTDPPQWLIIAATTDTQPLKNIPLENGQIAQEGAYEYLERSLHLMSQSDDEYTQVISQRVTEALEKRRIKYLHIHQTQASQTENPRDILQMQFQILG